MIFYLAKPGSTEKARVAFPASFSEIKHVLYKLEHYEGGASSVRIQDAEGPAKKLVKYLRHAELEWQTGVDKLNRLARRFDSMDSETRELFFAVLDARITSSIYNVMNTLADFDQYELVHGVSTDQELGKWLVEQGMAGVYFPKPVLPYLDYAAIGAGYYADHDGAYTPSGYVKRRKTTQTQKEEEKTAFVLTLASPAGTYRLGLPASDDDLEQAKGALRLDDLDSAAIRDVEIDYPWAHLLDMDSITLQDAHILAKCVQEMTAQELRVFGAVLEAEQPNSFSDANLTAMYLDDYELVEDSEREYGREALRKAGADDEILDMLDGFTDFDALGRSEMEADGVRETSFGHVRRLSAPWPEQGPEIGQTMC